MQTETQQDRLLEEVGAGDPDRVNGVTAFADNLGGGHSSLFFLEIRAQSKDMYVAIIGPGGESIQSEYG
jgi:hypothetical protein